ncbi:nucleotidyltransferase family protein [Methylocystis sp. Sn-Cys]|uniref:nucleotidyltransferase family protein n=1 Tax=Methylocystis sp. Sn-Cys TaxID=1701263 RepID=UPI001921B6B5|nr:nucleotidyltransferase family protein [Methylocystis sp. Sn-Cys]MBL1257969.1 nucleotidyltransferase family protein [Methylocystis sp. Sn-Cys]
MVFAAGLGTRMRPLTDQTPKPLVTVAGRTLIDRALDDFARAGIETAIVNVHHLADQIEAHLVARREPRIVISDERTLLLDQGGGIKKVLPLIGEDPFFICNTDAFWFGAPQSNLLALAQAWNADEMDAALLLAPTQGSIGVDWDGDFDLSEESRIIRRAGPKPYVYSGVGLIKPQLFAQETSDVFKLAPFFFSAAEKGRLFGVVSTGLWLHVGTVAAIAEAEKAILAQGR